MATPENSGSGKSESHQDGEGKILGSSVSDAGVSGNAEQLCQNRGEPDGHVSGSPEAAGDSRSELHESKGPPKEAGQEAGPSSDLGSSSRKSTPRRGDRKLPENLLGDGQPQKRAKSGVRARGPRARSQADL